ncbi:Uncharacterised protein [Mycobacteroides abscessus subsp. abscessus]|nr:Uncharacterised protein [Mycobacteroides abscessus subsp. abscessus]
MIPNTSVNPAASRNSSTPYCSPFSNCVSKRVKVMAVSYLAAHLAK